MAGSIQQVWEIDEFIIKQAKYWWNSAQRRKHVFDKFMSGWVSFNILYNFITRKYRSQIHLSNNDIRSEPKRVKSTVKFLFDDQLWSDDLKRSINELIGFETPISYRQYPHGNSWISTDTIVSEIREAIENGKNDEALIKSYEIIYHVRCNLFHGEKSDDNQRDIEAVALCWEIMKYSYPLLLRRVDEIFYNGIA